MEKEAQIVVKFTPVLGWQRAPLSVYIELPNGMLVMPGSQFALEHDPLLSELGEELQRLFAEPEVAARFRPLRERWLEGVTV